MAGELIPDFSRIRRECESEGVAFPETMFSPYKVQVSKDLAEKMAEIVSAIERVSILDAYRDRVLQWAPDIARIDPGTKGVFFGYDFHIGETGPKLIEINTNAGGAYLNVLLLRAWGVNTNIEDVFFDMFMAEWRMKRGDRPLQRVAIVDEDCTSQFLHPEFCLFKKLFEKRGIAASVIDASDLKYRSGALQFEGKTIDLVYNRLTDFALEGHDALRRAYLEDAAVITPHPKAHALFADKRNLSVLSSRAALEAMGVDEETIKLLTRGIAWTGIVREADPEALWSERRRLFFKPRAGYGAKAVYRGEKLTRRVWEEILQGQYVYQEYVPAMEFEIEGRVLKYDYRNFAYDGKIQLLAARLYQGQATNFRTEGGGFAPVFIIP